MSRPTRPEPRTFVEFPEDVICPICGTNDNGTCVLVPIYGTREGNKEKSQPMHLACAVVRLWDDGMQMGYILPDLSE